MFLVTSPIVINAPTRGLLAVETMHAIVQWLENLNIKRLVCKQETSLYVFRLQENASLTIDQNPQTAQGNDSMNFRLGLGYFVLLETAANL